MQFHPNNTKREPNYKKDFQRKITISENYYLQINSFANLLNQYQNYTYSNLLKSNFSNFSWRLDLCLYSAFSH